MQVLGGPLICRSNRPVPQVPDINIIVHTQATIASQMHFPSQGVQDENSVFCPRRGGIKSGSF